MKIRNASIFLLALSLPTMFQGCRDHETVDPVNEEELITTLKIKFTKWDDEGEPTGEELVFVWRDEDGSGNPEIDENVLDSHSTYSMALEVLDESGTTPEDITAEIISEAAEHQFFFSIDGPTMSAEYNDEDENGKPIGVQAIAVVDQAATGSLTVTLRHEPEKNAAGVAEGDITNAGGDTDIEAVFPLTVVE